MTQYILNKAPSFSDAWHIWMGDDVACGRLTLKHIVRNSITTEIPSSVCKACLVISKNTYIKPSLNKRGDMLYGYSVEIKKRLADARKVWLWQNGKPLNNKGEK